MGVIQLTVRPDTNTPISAAPVMLAQSGIWSIQVKRHKVALIDAEYSRHMDVPPVYIITSRWPQAVENNENRKPYFGIHRLNIPAWNYSGLP